MSRLIEYYQLAAEDRSIQLVLEGEGRIRGDRLMIDRAVSNILSNALRYTPEGHDIAVIVTSRKFRYTPIIQ